MIKVREVEAKSILNKSKIFDYCVNPYTGCQVGCAYCYAKLFIPRYSGHDEPWGTFVDVKTNAPDLLRKQLRRAKRGTVWLSSVCDPYQPLEAKYLLTRHCLEALAESGFPVQVQSKSVLLLRDIEILARIRDLETGFTIATDDERTARLFEPFASTPMERARALGALRSRGIRTFAFIGPLLPLNPGKLAALLKGAVDRVLIDRMNYMETFRPFLVRHGFSDVLSEDYFRRTAAELASLFRSQGIEAEILF
ncbi:MAG: radical SAM protein [Candidatus Aminicenantes bacterium]|nr:radical SAM protein [Candidatus Aminicenantes bacterium]